jgi:hypothetical protein
MNADTRFLSPPTVAKVLGCGPDKILEFIARGELKAINTSLSDRARWKIDPRDFEAFCLSRSNAASIQPKRRVKLPKAKRNYLDE